MTGVKEALIVGILWATSFGRDAFNPMLIPLFSIIFIYVLGQIIGGKTKSIPVAFLIIGLGLQIHVQALFFLIPLVLVIYKKPVKEIVKGLFLFFLTFTPLIIFDLRHDFTNLKSLINFLSGQSGPSISFLQAIVASYLKFLNSAAGLLPEITLDPVKKGALFVFMSIVGIKFSKTHFQTKLILLSFIILPPLLFSFYKGNLSEYYFALTFVPVLIGFGALFKKIPLPISLLFILLVLILRYEVFMDKSYTLTLKYKKEAVSYIINDSNGQDFILHIDSSYGYANGFNYLFTYYKNTPKEKGEHLYLISIPWSQRQWAAKKMVNEDYNFKNAELKIFGDISVFKMY